MTARAFWLLLMATMLTCLAPVLLIAGTEDRPDSVVRFHRVLVPNDRMKDWPVGDGKYLPMNVNEFERLVAAMKSQDLKAPSAAIVTARYEAKLLDERLTGNAMLDVTVAGRASSLLPFSPCSLAIDKAFLDSNISPHSLGDGTVNISPLPLGDGAVNISPLPLGEGPGVRASRTLPKNEDASTDSPHPNPLPKGEGTVTDISPRPLREGTSAKPSSRVPLGLGDDGRLGALVERSGRMSFDWSLVGHRDSGDVLVFSFELPAAPANQLFVELPNGFTPTVDRGIILASESAGEDSRRWQIELGGYNQFRLRVVAVSAAHRRRQLALLRESRTYDCSLRGVEVSVRWKLQVHNEPLEQIAVLLDPELQLVSARLGDSAIPWSVSPAANGAGSRVTLRLPEPICDTDRVIRLAAIGRPVLDRPWRLPRIRAEGLLWQEGSISLLTPEPLAINRIVASNCVQTGTGSLSAPRTGQSMQFQSFDPDATVEVLLSRFPAKLEMLAASAIELDGQEATAHVAARFKASDEPRFVIVADVAPRWLIDAVESVPAGGVADWSIERQANGRQRLMIRLATAISSDRPLQLAIAGRRLFAPSSERLGTDDLMPLHFRDLAKKKRLVAVRSTGSSAMKLYGDERLNPLKAEDLAPSELALFAQRPSDLLFECNARSSSLAVSLVAREAKYTGTIRVDASIGDHVLRENIRLHCVPQSGRVDRVLVRLFPRRDTPPRWTLRDCDSSESACATETAALQNTLLSARRWSNEEQTAAGVDSSTETWELTLRRPRSDAFEIMGQREVPSAKLPVVISLASLPGVVDQTGAVMVSDLRTTGFRVENRRLKPILPEPPLPGQVQAIRGAFSYDPVRDVAAGAEAAVQICAASEPNAASAWIANCRLESWHQTDGKTRHMATYNVDSLGSKRLRLTMPPEIGRNDIQGVWIDGVTAAWRVATKKESRVVSVELPAQRKSFCVAIQWTSSRLPLGMTGVLAAPLPQPDLPVLARHWTAWLPPGYEGVDSGVCEQPCDVDAIAASDTQGWTSRNISISAELPVALRYARTASMRLLGAVVFLLAVGFGWWAIKKRMAVVAVFIALLSVFIAAAITLPSAYVPMAFGGVSGMLFCLTLRWIHRDAPPTARPTDRSTSTNGSAVNSKPGSTVAMIAPLGLLFLAALLTFLFCGSALGADWPQPSESWPENGLGKIKIGSNTIHFDAESPSDKPLSPAASREPLYRVFVPVDAKRKPVGGKVYLPEAFYQQLYRHAAPAEKPLAWLILGATYQGELTENAVAGQLEMNALRAQYDLRVFGRATRVRIPLRTEGVNLLPGSALLDGRAIELEWEPNSAALAFDVAEPGDYRLELSLRPTIRSTLGARGFDVAIPRVAAARLELTLPDDAPSVEVPSACGGVFVEREPSLLLADLGPADRLTVRWQEAASSGGSRAAVDAEQLTWLKIQPGSVVVAAKFRFRVAEGQLRQVQLAVDPRLRLLPLSGDDPPTVQIASDSGQTRLLTIRWPRPISDQVALEATFLFNGASAVGNIRPPHIELLDVQPTRRWMAVSVDPALDSDERQTDRLEAVSVADFIKAWGAADVKPKAAYRLPSSDNGWTLSTRPHEPRITADQTLTLSFDEDRADVLFDAQLSVASGYVFQYQVTAPKNFKIERVSVVGDDADCVQRWSQEKDGRITIFLNGPASGAERLSIRGQLPIRLDTKRELPAVRVEKCEIASSTIRLFRRPGVSLTIDGVGRKPESPQPGKAPSEAAGIWYGSCTVVPDSAKKTPEFGRLVKTFAWDRSGQPLPSVAVKSSRSEQETGRQSGEKTSNGTAKNAKNRVAAQSPSLVRLADVTVAWQSDGNWRGVAAFDLEPGGTAELDLHLPNGCELVQALIEDMPAGVKRIGDDVWRLGLASADAPQRVEVIFRGVMPETARTGRFRFQSPTLGNLPVRRTLWTVFSPPLWTASEPQASVAVHGRPRSLPQPKIAAAIGGPQLPTYYLSEGGETSISLDCRPAADCLSHRWAAATVFLLFGIALAGVVALGKQRAAFQK